MANCDFENYAAIKNVVTTATVSLIIVVVSHRAGCWSPKRSERFHPCMWKLGLRAKSCEPFLTGTRSCTKVHKGFVDHTEFCDIIPVNNDGKSSEKGEKPAKNCHIRSDFPILPDLVGRSERYCPRSGQTTNETPKTPISTMPYIVFLGSRFVLGSP